jgi:hypothetical protein
MFLTHSIVKYVEPRMVLLQHWKQVKRVFTVSQVKEKRRHGNNNAMIGDGTQILVGRGQEIFVHDIFTCKGVRVANNCGF